MTYQDFDLLIESVAGGFRARVLNSPAGQASVDFALPFTNDKLENVLLRLGRSKTPTRRVDSSEMQTAKSFGAALFEAVFSGGVRVCFDSSVNETRRQGVGLRVRLRLSAAVADLPWEYLYNPAVNRFMALSVQSPLVRYIELPDRLQPVTVKPPIRALVLISSPGDYPQLDVESEWKKLNASLEDLCQAGLVSIDRLDDATLSVLQRRLRQSQYHIFHFIGHGEFDEESQEGLLILEDENHRGHRVGSQYLGMLLHDHDSLRLAILNACDGARTSRLDPFAGSAQTLVQQGIPAVIAMQFEISDEVAGTFAHEFYGAVADGYPIDAAVTEARKAIFAAGHDVEWGTPVLYLRAPDGRIFDVERQPRAEPARKSPSQQAADLVRNAGIALANGKYADALNFLARAHSIDAQTPNLDELMDTAEQQRAVAETRAKRRRAMREHLDAAAELFANGELSGALRHVREALEFRPDDRDALVLEARIQQAQADRAQDRTPRDINAPDERQRTGEREALVGGSRPAEQTPAASAGGGTPADRRKPVDGERDLLD